MIIQLLSRGRALTVMCAAAILCGYGGLGGAGALDALTSHDAAGGLRAALVTRDRYRGRAAWRPKRVLE